MAVSTTGRWIAELAGWIAVAGEECVCGVGQCAPPRCEKCPQKKPTLHYWCAVWRLFACKGAPMLGFCVNRPNCWSPKGGEGLVAQMPFDTTWQTIVGKDISGSVHLHLLKQMREIAADGECFRAIFQLQIRLIAQPTHHPRDRVGID